MTVLCDRLADCLWPFLLAAAAANILSAVLKAVTWRCLLAGVRGVDDRLRSLDLVSPLLVGALVNTGLPGRVGEVAKVVLARRRIDRRGGVASVAQVAGSIAAEHLVSTLAWGVIAVAVVCVLSVPGPIRAMTIFAGAGCLLATALIAGLPAPARALQVRWRRTSRATIEAWAAIHQGLHALRRPRSLWSVSAASAGQWAAQWAAIILGLGATGLGQVGPGAAAMILVTLTLAHAVPLLPGGVGTFQVAAMLPLTEVYGVEPGAALAFGPVLQLSEMAVSVCLGVVFLIRENLAQPPRESATTASWRLVALRNAMRSSSA